MLYTAIIIGFAMLTGITIFECSIETKEPQQAVVVRRGNLKIYAIDSMTAERTLICVFPTNRLMLSRGDRHGCLLTNGSSYRSSEYQWVPLSCDKIQDAIEADKGASSNE
jgi:hypothetical protein